MLRVVIALRLFLIDRDRPPESLAELCPDFLDSIPIDLDGKAIRYRRDKGLISSVGEDLEDHFSSSQSLEEKRDLLFSFTTR